MFRPQGCYSPSRKYCPMFGANGTQACFDSQYIFAVGVKRPVSSSLNISNASKLGL